MNTEIKLIIERVKGGKEPTQQEKDQVQQWVHDTIISVDLGQLEIIEDIQSLFPEEYSSAIDAKDDDMLIGEYHGINPKSHHKDITDEEEIEYNQMSDSFLDICPNCHQAYDDADYDFQICHYCWWDAKNNQYTKK